MAGRVVRYVDRLVWLKQVQKDHDGLPPSALTIALVIIDHVDEHGEAFPSQPTMAEITGLNVRAVRRATDALAERGHLAVKVTRGRNTFNRYVPLWLPSTLQAPPSPESGPENRTARAGFEADGDTENRTGRAGFENGKPDISSSKTGQFEHENRTQRAAYQTLDQTLRPDDARKGAPDVRVGMSEDALRALAIDAAGGNVEVASRGIRNVQPLRAWMAEGFDLDRHILPAISASVADYRQPLRTWKAGWLDAEVRRQRTADRDSSAEPSIVSAPLDPARYVYAGNSMHSRARVVAARQQFDEVGTWSGEFGMPPDSPLADLPEEFRGPRRKPASPISSPDPEKDGSGTRNNA